jgi:hypothetical protein
MSKVYSLAGVLVAMGGVQINGPGEGGFIKAEKKTDDFEVQEMADGAVIFSYTGSRLWIVTITCSQTSQANTILSALRETDVAASRAGQGGIGVVPGIVTDLNGATLLVSPRARILAPPSVEFSNKAKDRDWKIAFTDCLGFVGGQT